jgi:hypothetical protein
MPRAALSRCSKSPERVLSNVATWRWKRATKALAPPPAVAFRASAARSLCCRRSAASSWWRFFLADAASLRGDRIVLPLNGMCAAPLLVARRQQLMRLFFWSHAQ